MKKILCTLLIVPIMLTGCSSTMSDKQQTQAQGAGFGAILGAVAGAIIGNQLDNPAAGALIGGALGAAAGGAYGTHVANRKADFASQEDYLNACIDEAYQRYVDAKSYNESLTAEVASLQDELNRLQATAEVTKDDASAFASLKETLKIRQTEAQQQLDALSDEIAVQRQVLAQEQKGGGGKQLSVLEEQIANLEKQKAQLEQSTMQLASLSNRASA